MSLVCCSMKIFKSNNKKETVQHSHIEKEEQKPEFRDSKAIFLRTANPDAHGAKEDGKYISKCYNLVSKNAKHLESDFERFILDMLNKKLGQCKIKFFGINKGWTKFVAINEEQDLSENQLHSAKRCMGFVEGIFRVLTPFTIDVTNSFWTDKSTETHKQISNFAEEFEKHRCDSFVFRMN